MEQHSKNNIRACVQFRRHMLNMATCIVILAGGRQTGECSLIDLEIHFFDFPTSSKLKNNASILPLGQLYYRPFGWKLGSENWKPLYGDYTLHEPILII